ncbi:Trifunctional nucleotide phosphoesterase protein YfkN [Paragonimus heterotremus]|uniref:Trifunctional nucleotide phosphoesterase protein YfkN n=1 Tax=Paragonimus heterotremus TaxID=100268 RepID=A0A8J4SF75_9TREM|nr:Trifunctional nucleotide phosphoesterase protein YfkN [Paragonimus heterotremus]
MGNWPPSANKSKRVKIHILHFGLGDVKSEVETRGVVAVARFISDVEELRTNAPENTLVMCSGSLLRPSTLNLTTKGSHMIAVGKKLQIDCCVIGNHDFDFGVDNLMDCVKQSNFPWLNGNFYDANSMQLFGALPQYHVIKKAEIKIGVIGLIEPEWIKTVSAIDQTEVIVKDFCAEGRRLANELRCVHRCHLVIALTHMSWPNDLRLAREVAEIDLVLGGYDQTDGFEVVTSVDGKDRWVVKSGYGFNCLRQIQLFWDPTTQRLVKVLDKVKPIDVSITVDSGITDIVEKTMSTFNESLNRVIGKLDVPLDGRFAMIRTRETNLGNFLADVALTSVDADCAILNSSIMRFDSIIPEGVFTLRYLNLLLPKLTPIVVLEVTGAELIEVLENAVSQVPELNGRFVQVSKIKFAYHSNYPQGERLEESMLLISGRPVNREQCYRLATTGSMARGEDGYRMLLNKERIVHETNAITLDAAVVNYFQAIDILNDPIKTGRKHRPHLIRMKARRLLVQTIMSDQQARGVAYPKPSLVPEELDVANGVLLDETSRQQLKHVIADKENKRRTVAPKVQRRIVNLDQD